MRFAPPRLAVPLALLTLVLAGCGGATKVIVEDTPGGPVQLTTPGTAQALAPAATPTPTPTADASTGTSSTDSTSTDSTTTTQPQATATATPAADANGGTTAPSATSTPPAPGSSAQQFEDFCTQNPGAC